MPFQNLKTSRRRGRISPDNRVARPYLITIYLTFLVKDRFRPHTADQIASDNWNRPYTREAAAFPAKSLHDYKFWPHVGRVDNVFGDRNPVCSCVGMENNS